LTFSFFSEKHIHTSLLFPCRKSGNVPLKKTRAKAVARLTAWDKSTAACGGLKPGFVIVSSESGQAWLVMPVGLHELPPLLGMSPGINDNK
jgi:hypothetical protein